MTTPTKAHLEAELVEYRECHFELRHSILPTLLAELAARTDIRPVIQMTIIDAQRWLETEIVTAEDRASGDPPAYPVSRPKIARREPVNCATHDDFRHERIDGLPVTAGPTDTCPDCGEVRFLLSCPKRSGGYFVARVGLHGFRHTCGEVLR